MIRNSKYDSLLQKRTWVYKLFHRTSQDSGVARDHIEEVVDFILVKHPNLS
jgi:hypothetical protein